MGALLRLREVETSYGNSQVLFGVSLEVARGSVTTLLGRNGMGKTTTINTIIGHLRHHGGSITFNAQTLGNLRPYQIAQLGIGLVPEGRQIFPNLTLKENLIATAAQNHQTTSPWTLDRVLGFFPLLKNRLNNMGNQLSGGEQQMLAIGRALMLNPSLLILDEATEGLAPLIRQEIFQLLSEIKSTGMSILLIDKNLHDICKIADHHYIIEKGQIVWEGDSNALLSEQSLCKKYLSL